MKITAYGGAGKIGGNKFLLEAGGARIFLDFGEPFDRGEPFYTGMEFMKPRKNLGLKDYFEFDMIPQIEGLYDAKHLVNTNLPYKPPAFDAVIISHIHCDHMGDIEWMDAGIPVYMGHGAKALNDIYNVCYPYQFRRKDNGNVREFKTGDVIRIKELEIMPVHVDHSTPAAYGFVIKTPEGTITYTGDYRMHGFRPEMTRDLIKAGAGSDILMTEGTRMRPQEDDDPFREAITENDVMEKMAQMMKEEKGLILADFSVKNIDRLRSMYEACRASGRVMMINPRTAYIMKHAAALFTPTLPDPLKDPLVKIFRKNADNESARELSWEKEFLASAVGYEWVAQNQGSAAMLVTDTELQQLIDIKPKEGSFIYSMSEHYIEGEDNEEKRIALNAWLGHFNIKFKQAHCSGHADREAIKEMVNGIAPGRVIPMHTEHPEEFKKLHKDVVVLETGKLLEL